ncbi:hypothetical protein [Ralstonia phage phiRSL1]|uniref:Uncharacterized protein n=1 Tax=Ralstonia phage phiRSL1 TaxID=1980924 RepID=B2ZXM1_9CAUD|nr:hypothetical protein RSL1_ORF002 [Ralstonia phage phiRSL1]BAG41447.1 hypothetical protein [Ralstonia phage phiRSL1]
MPHERQLKRLNSAIKKVKVAVANGYPQGTKRHVVACLNELTTIREGVYLKEASKEDVVLDVAVRSVAALQQMVQKAETPKTEVVSTDSDTRADVRGHGPGPRPDEGQLSGYRTACPERAARRGDSRSHHPDRSRTGGRQAQGAGLQRAGHGRVPCDPRSVGTGRQSQGSGGYERRQSS